MSTIVTRPIRYPWCRSSIRGSCKVSGQFRTCSSLEAATCLASRLPIDRIGETCVGGSPFRRVRGISDRKRRDCDVLQRLDPGIERFLCAFRRLQVTKVSHQFGGSSSRLTRRVSCLSLDADGISPLSELGLRQPGLWVVAASGSRKDGEDGYRDSRLQVLRTLSRSHDELGDVAALTDQALPPGPRA